MKYIKEKEMFKNSVLLLSGLFLFFGCSSDKKPQESSSKEPSQKIKIIENSVNTNVKEKSEKNSDGGKFYYALSDKNKNEDKTKEEKTRTTIDAYLNIKSPYERVRITMMIKKLSKDYVLKCSPCHDDYANGVIGPSLLDKDGEFIYQRIMDFKNGKKKNVLMKELVSNISDERLKSIAEEIANFNKQIRKMREERR